MRIKAAPTAVSNIFVGLWLSGQWTAANAVAALLASVSFCSAGMVLNDVADVQKDRRLAPSRPLPNSDIPVHVATLVGCMLLACGCALSFYLPAGVAGGISLMAVILLYNFGPHQYSLWWSLPLMAACRGFNLAMGVGEYWNELCVAAVLIVALQAVATMLTSLEEDGKPAPVAWIAALLIMNALLVLYQCLGGGLLAVIGVLAIFVIRPRIMHSTFSMIKLYFFWDLCLIVQSFCNELSS